MDAEKENQENATVAAAMKSSSSSSSSPSKVMERTKDLLVPEERTQNDEGMKQQQQEGSVIDWGWGKDDAPKDEKEIRHETKVQEGADDDSDVTAEMSEEEEVDDSWDPRQAAANAATALPPVDGTKTTDPENADGTEGSTTINAPDDDSIEEPERAKDESAGDTENDVMASAGAANDTKKDLVPAASPAKEEEEEKLVLYESSGEEESLGDVNMNDGDVGSSSSRSDSKEKSKVDNEDASTASPSTSRNTRHSSRARKPSKRITDDSDNDDEEEEGQAASPIRKPNRKTAAKTKQLKRRPSPPLPKETEEPDADDETESPTVARSKAEKPPSTSTSSNEQPDDDDLLRSTDYLFLEADKDSVTVADICRALCNEYDCKLSKSTKRLIRDHLIDLMKGNVKLQVANKDDEQEGEESSQEEEEEDQVSEQGDAESEASDFEQADAGSDEEYQEKEKSSRSRKGKAAKKTATNKPKSDKSTAKLSKLAKRPNQRKAAKVARKMELERLRKKRMEELRIRNEEMQVNQSKEEQERAEAIAARLDTNTDELRLKRLEDRLTLLELLDKKRIAVIDALEDKIEDAQKAAAAEAAAKKAQEKAELAVVEEEDEESEEESSSDEEEELDIVGISKPLKPLKLLHTHLPSKAVAILKQVKTPQPKPKEPVTTTTAAGSTKIVQLVSPTQLFKATSPTKRKGARAHLRQALRHKQRKQGNLWLARELGYKTEEDHLKDCQTAADQKHTLVRKLEQARVQANERRLLRERILQQEVGFGEEEGDGKSKEDDEEAAAPEEEEDEEMQMAKEIETHTEQSSDTATDEANPSPSVAAETSEESINNQDKADNSSPDFPAGDDDDILKDSQSPWETQPPIPSLKAWEDRKTENDSEEVSAEQPEADSSTRHTHPDGTDAKEPAGADTDINKTAVALKSKAEKNDSAFEDSDDEGEIEFVDDKEPEKDPNRPRNAAWQAMLRKEAEMLKKQKRRKQGLVEDQAEEEEEEEVAGLEDFGFSVKKKQDDDDDDEAQNDELDEEDLKHVVDDVSDNEGDEEAGVAARKRQERLEEKEHHKEIMRRMREGYDGRRGGIAGGGVGARGMHRFDQLVAADNREDAKRLGLLNDDELDSDDDEDKKENKNTDDHEDDEAALLDKMLKDRFLHRSDVDIEENFSEDEEDQEETNDAETGEGSDAEEERTQDRLAKRFAKRARMQRLEEEFADSQEFSQQRLIDEDESMRHELRQMKNGLLRRRSTSTSTRSSISSQDSLSNSGHKRIFGSTVGIAPMSKAGSSLSIALRASRKVQQRTTFLGGDKGVKSRDGGALIHKSVALSHVVFTSSTRTSFSDSGSNVGTVTGKRKSGPAGLASSSLFQKVARKAQ